MAVDIKDSVLGGHQAAVNVGFSQESVFKNQNNSDHQSQNVNLVVFNSDVYMTTTQFPEEARATARDNATFENPTEDHANVPGCLPDYKTINMPLTVDWERKSDGSVRTINTSTIVDAYDEITNWRKNTFSSHMGKLEGNQTQHCSLMHQMLLIP